MQQKKHTTAKKKKQEKLIACDSAMSKRKEISLAKVKDNKYMRYIQARNKLIIMIIINLYKIWIVGDFFHHMCVCVCVRLLLLLSKALIFTVWGLYRREGEKKRDGAVVI